MVEGQRDVVPVTRGARLDDLDRPAARVADVALVARSAGQRPVVLLLEAGEPLVVEARVAEIDKEGVRITVTTWAESPRNRGAVATRLREESLRRLQDEGLS